MPWAAQTRGRELLRGEGAGMGAQVVGNVGAGFAGWAPCDAVFRFLASVGGNVAGEAWGVGSAQGGSAPAGSRLILLPGAVQGDLRPRQPQPYSLSPGQPGAILPDLPASLRGATASRDPQPLTLRVYSPIHCLSLPLHIMRGLKTRTVPGPARSV